MLTNRFILSFLFFSLLTLTSCKKEKNSDTNYSYQISKVKSSFIANNKYIFGQHKASTIKLKNSISSFNSQPIITFFNFSKTNWVSSYGYFNQSKPIFYMNFNNSPLPPNLDQIDISKMNIEYVDYSSSNPSAGIINNPVQYPVLSYQEIINLHQIGSPENLTLGYHVLEFLLWGEDLNASGPGARSNIDFSTSDVIKNRRRTFLVSTTQFLYSQVVTDNSWEKQIEDEILLMDGKEFIKKTFNGMIEFIEQDFADQTLLTPYNSQNINDELSKFSDNTINDLKNKNLAIKYFIYGNDSIEVQNDYALADLLEEVDHNKSTILLSEINNCTNIINSIQGDFDAALTNGEREKLKQISDSLYRISAILKEYLSDLNIN